ncbi:MAG: hypothetical protein QNJ78_11790 [Gammaproteobacteria bacterium]|nr:hypothetical protein [Gammaproteobacteria bacterium]
MKKKLFLVMAGTLLALQAHAYQFSGKYDIGKMSEEANLVFRGTVIAVDYRSSRAKGQQRPLPHTFVTFQVEDVLHGDLKSNQFTLRFLGGKTKKGEIMMTSAQPKFDVGDQDLVFVKGNGISECPLVGCSQGRFRILNGLLYNEDGQQIVQDEKGAIKSGKTEALEALNSFHIGKQRFSRLHHKERSKDGNGYEIRRDDLVGAYHLDEGSFTGLVRSNITKALQKAPQSMREVARSVDKNRPFSAVQSKPVALPEPEADFDPAVEMSEEELNEVKAMEKSGGNPVLK